MTNKKRWQKLAGIQSEEKKSTKKQLKEGFTNFGMATPGVMGNPFEGRMSQTVVEEAAKPKLLTDLSIRVYEFEGELFFSYLEKDTGHSGNNALQDLEKLVMKYVNNAQDKARAKSLYGESVNETQFAKDALEDIDTSYQPDPGEDYEPNPRTPKFTGAILDDDDFAERGVEFNPEDEGLSVRSVDDELDPEYGEDDLGDLFGDRAWPDIVDGTNRKGTS
jgi:hypothetical protein